MLNSERTPLLASDDDSIISKNSATAQENNKDPEALADGPRIPGLKLSVIIPAMAIGVWFSNTTWRQWNMRTNGSQVFLAAMDNTIVVSSYGAIGTEMKELNRTSWIATACVFSPAISRSWF